MKLYPESAAVQLELDKVKALLHEKCRTEYAKEKALHLRLHTHKDWIDRELKQAYELKVLLQNGIHFPNDFSQNLSTELRLLQIENSVLSGEQLISINRLTQTIEDLFRWFHPENRSAYPALTFVIEHTYYEKKIHELITEIIDEKGIVRDNASPELQSIRINLNRRRGELRRLFDRIINKLNKQGYLAEIEESFMNGRRVLAVFAEQKRTVKGILHGESDSRRTSFIEPEETVELNNQIYELESAERREVIRLLKELTQKLSVYSPLLNAYHIVVGEYDFISAKALLAISMNGEYPVINDKVKLELVNARHPLLYLYNLKSGKPTIPVNLTLDENNRILVISGPNAGGKTVTLKTVGLLQMMVQSGLLVPVDPASQFGIFKRLMIHIGDTQNLEFELSTYSSHLLSMKEFMETAGGKTLFFIDELGSGSDPNLGGAFAEVILEELAFKRAYGIVTTHYLNLKVMANKTSGIINGAMEFDEQNLLPLYKLIIGKPGSSYTFAIAERIGMDKKLIQRARRLVDEDHFKLDKLLNSTEQELRKIEQKDIELQKALKLNEKLRKEMEETINHEKHKQQVEILKQQNRINEERLIYLKDMERKLRNMVIEWKKTDDKAKVVREMAALLFKKNENKTLSKKQKIIESKYEELNGDIQVGAKVKMKRNLQVGEVLELRGKKAVVKIGLLPMQVDLENLVLIKEKEY
jgi:DNA mismatch repair protein MutS2